MKHKVNEIEMELLEALQDSQRYMGMMINALPLDKMTAGYSIQISINQQLINKLIKDSKPSTQTYRLKNKCF